MSENNQNRQFVDKKRQVLENKAIDGGQASPSRFIVVPHGTTTELAALERRQGSIAYDTTLDSFVVDDGSAFNPISGGGGTPGGSNGDVQFNNSGSFDGESGFTYGGNGDVALDGTASRPLTVTSTDNTPEMIFGNSVASGRSFVGTWHDNTSPRYMDLHLYGVDNLIHLRADGTIALAPISGTVSADSLRINGSTMPGSCSIKIGSGSTQGMYVSTGSTGADPGLAIEAGAGIALTGTNGALGGTVDMAVQGTAVVLNAYGSGVSSNNIKLRYTKNDVQTVLNNGYDTVLFDDVDYDNSSGAFVNGVFTAPHAGKYLFVGCTTWECTSAGAIMSALHQNGSEVARGNRMNTGAAAQTWGVVYNNILNLAQGDTVAIRVRNETGASINLEAYGPSNSICITELV